jgi:hypothetical protein
MAYNRRPSPDPKQPQPDDELWLDEGEEGA